MNSRKNKTLNFVGKQPHQLEPEEKSYLDLIERLVENRKMNGWSQKKLAQKAGVTQGEISLFENGQSYLNIVTIFKIANVLKVRIKLKDFD